MHLNSFYGDAKPSVHPVALSCTPLLLAIYFVGILVGYTVPGLILGVLFSKWYYRDAKLLAYSPLQPRTSAMLAGFRFGVYIRSIPNEFWDDVCLLIDHHGTGKITVPGDEKSMFYKVLSDYLSRHHSAVQVEANGELSVIGQYQADQDDQVISLPQDIQSDLPLTKGHRKIQLD